MAMRPSFSLSPTATNWRAPATGSPPNSTIASAGSRKSSRATATASGSGTPLAHSASRAALKLSMPAISGRRSLSAATPGMQHFGLRRGGDLVVERAHIVPDRIETERAARYGKGAPDVASIAPAFRHLFIGEGDAAAIDQRVGGD